MKNKLFKIITLVTTFAVGITLAVNHNVNPVKAETVTYDFNYDPYTYSGSFYSDKEIDFDATGGMNGELRTTLRSKLTPEAFYTYYKQGETHLATQLQYCDEDPTNKNNMVYFYTRDSVAKNPATTWNREHVWCQSRSNDNWGTDEGGVDLLHLRPTYNVANSTRNNFPYGDTNHTNPKTTEGCFYGYLVNGYFEPLDCVKGDVARIIMYVWTIYDGYKNYNSLSIPNIIRDYDTLLRWHTLDKPDVLEGNRNDYVQTSRQKNRNPYVDHPELAWKIFGDQASTSIKNACMEAYPANGGGSGQTIDPTGISLNKSTASVSAGKTLQLRATLQPTGASGTVTWSSNNTSVATVDSNGLVTAKTAGQATITATVGTYSATCVITVTAAVINYGTAENPISVADAIELIDAAGSSTTSQPMYVKGVVSSNEEYSPQHSNYYHVWLTNNENNVADSFQLYKAKASSTITDTYTSEDSLKDLEIVAYGYGQKYGSTYELTASNSLNPANPQILSVGAPSATDIELNTYEAEIDVGETITLTATLTPSNTEDTYTWESLDEGIATVDNGGVVTGVGAGTTIITARVNEELEADCVVTVTDSSETTFGIADSISVGDTVYLGCSSASAQYNGPSGTGTDAYGLYAEYNQTPDTDIYPLEVCEGSLDDTFAFKITAGDHANKYLGWSGTKNSLKVTPTLDDNSSWTVAFTNNGNATISNGANAERVIWWNASSPRFACYTGKTEGTGYYGVQLWKNTTVVPHIENPYDYLDTSTSFTSISGTTHASGNQQTTDTIVFADLGLDNGVQYSEPFEKGGFTILFAGGSNDGRYYDGGTGIRTYANGTITIQATGLISEIVFTWDGSNKPNSANVANPGTYNVSTGTWTGSSTSVTLTRPSGSGHWRLQSAEVTYINSSVTVDNVAMRFGASISIDDWTEINSKWTIEDFGVICLKKTTLDSYASQGITTAKDAFLQGKKVTKLGNKNNLEHPYPVGDNYVFTVRIGVSDPDNYLMEVCAVPYIYAGGQYYFFDEIDPYSVKTLAQYYLDNPSLECALPQSALRVLAASQGGN